MNKITLAVVLLFYAQLILSQDLYVGSDSYLTLPTGSIIAVNGLVLSPSTTYTVASNMSITRLSTAANTGNVAILRQYTFSQALTNYKGALFFHYEDAELNGAIETELDLQLYGSDTMWHPFTASVDTNQNTLTYNFTTGVDFSGITADFNEALSEETSFGLEYLTVYPNPTYNEVFIKYPHAIRTTLHNTVGQELEKGTSHYIDLSLYARAIYFLIIEDVTKQTKKMVKIIKR
ncbi:MAG: hypothetical protein ACJAUQ_001935 [Maribacter sp.]|jgi:hypothetical protein